MELVPRRAAEDHGVEEVHRSVSKESAWTEAGAKKEVAKTAAKRLPKEVGGD